MKKAVVFMAIMLVLTILSTGTVYAAENGFDVKANDKNPAFDAETMHGNMQVVKNVNNEDLHFSNMGHIMIPGNAGENTESPIFEPEMGVGHLSPPGRVKQFPQDM